MDRWARVTLQGERKATQTKEGWGKQVTDKEKHTALKPKEMENKCTVAKTPKATHLLV